MATLTGTNGNDTLEGGAENDTIYGLDGNDLLSGGSWTGAGHNLLDGGAGNDYLVGQEGDDTLIGGAGADFLNGGNPITGGINTASYASASSAIRLVQRDEANWTGDAQGDQLVGIQIVVGTNFNDIITFGDGSDFNTVFGGEGNDTLSGIGSRTHLIGGVGADHLSDAEMASYVTATSGIYLAYGDGGWTGDAAGDVLVNIFGVVGSDYNDTISWDNNDNQLEGGAGNDTLNGMAGNDTLIGGTGNDKLDGGLGDDVLIGGAGADTLAGYASHESNTASYATATSGIYLAMGDGAHWTGDAQGDNLILIQNIIGTDYGDLIQWGSFFEGPGYISGGDGNDTLYGSWSGMTVIGGAGADVISYAEEVSYETADAGVYVVQGDGSHWTGDAAGDVIDAFYISDVSGSEYDDALLWTDFANVLDGLSGNDSLYGMGGDDTLIGGIGADLIVGGSGTNTASYATALTGFYLAYGDGGNWFGESSGDVLIDIQNIIGSSHDDIILWNDNDNLITGGAGNDTLYGMGGNDTLEGGTGADMLIGGAGNNTASYAASTSGVYVAFGDGAHWTNEAAGDQFYNIQNITGTGWRDRLAGDGNANILSGMESDDTLYGMGGDDTLIGGEGEDDLIGGAGNNTISYENTYLDLYVVMGDGGHWTGEAFHDRIFDIQNIIGSSGNDTLGGDAGANILTGGRGSDRLYGFGGADTFRYNAVNEGLDYLMDFSALQGDKIDVGTSAFGIASLTLGVNFFSGAGAGPASGVASLYFDSALGVLYYDADGTGGGAAVQLATIAGVTSLAVTDFIFHP